MSKFKQLDATIQEKTKVIFRKFASGEIIALFPELAGTGSVLTCLNYMHEGQHGAANASVQGTKPAKPEEYKPLYDELTSLGYNLTVVTRFSYQMDQKRIASLRRG